jgi:8-oxo-dGTP diphosphatase
LPSVAVVLVYPSGDVREVADPSAHKRASARERRGCGTPARASLLLCRCLGMTCGARVLQIASALVRRGTDVLMVLQKGPGDPEAHWALAGGVVEPGELATEALVREVREETGLEVLDPGTLAYVVQRDEPRGLQVVVYGFEVRDWKGEVSCEDPDGLVLDARFFPLARAVGAAEAIPWLDDPRPITAFLGGGLPAGALWLFRTGPGGKDVLVERVSRGPSAGV